MRRYASRRSGVSSNTMRVLTILFVFVPIASILGKPTSVLLGYQDTLGQYSFGYSGLDSARSEVRSLDGSTRGSYSYVDEAGYIQSAEYTADGDNGFRIVATNLPQAPRPVEDTPEVAAARAAHLQVLEQASRLAEDDLEVKNLEATGKNAENDIVEVKAAAEESVSAVEVTPESASNATEVEDVAEEKSKATEADSKPSQARTIIESVETPVPAEAPVVPAVPTPILIPINQNLPLFGTIDTRPEALFAQGVNSTETITPAGTMLKIAKQMIPIERPAVQSEIGRASAEVTSDLSQVERAKTVFSPVNVVSLGYGPAFSTFVRYSSVPYVTYNVL